MTRAPRDHGPILALTAAIADLGTRIRDTHPGEDVSGSGLRYLSADDIWMLNLTVDVICLLAGEIAREGARWLDEDSPLDLSLGNIDRATRDRHWKRALRQAGAGPAQFRQLRADVPRRTLWQR